MARFCSREEIPHAVTDHVRHCLGLAPETEPDHGADRTMRLHRGMVRKRQGATRDPRRARALAAAARRGPRDAAIIAVLLDTGARVEECARLEVEDFAITARTGEVRLHGKGDEVRYAPLARRARDLVSAWLNVRGRHPGPIWTGQRGPLTVSGVTQVVLAAGDEACR